MKFIAQTKTQSIEERIYDLQVEQLKHDELFHKDVVIMSLPDRVKHMALHNAKYIGYFIEAIDRSEVKRFEAVLTDAFIITLATANTLNQDLGQSVAETGVSDGWLAAPAKGRASQIDHQAADPFAFVKAYACEAGGLAKVCESWDHLEDVPFLKLMRERNLGLFKLVTGEATLRQLDLESMYLARLRVIEKRTIFHRTFTNQKNPH
ncbi:hypothetical protein [Rhizobium leguminosarum]|uniref:hypothetical protein n=1 Tax=Rhizobium leguminosarum TaxID=384 RepID=UPI0014414513|nr:hypothetical protein [Rhizobium leguminosarum]NKL54504.1 hypothetical protein [Rhizobium leguminosarum bv. viciae]